MILSLQRSRMIRRACRIFPKFKFAQEYPMVGHMYSNLPKWFRHPCIVKSIKGPRQLFFCNLTVQKAYKSSLKNAHESGYWMCEIGEKIKPQFKVDLIQFVNATTCCWNKKKLLLKVLLWWEVIQKTTYSRYHIQKLTKAWNIYLTYQRALKIRQSSI